MKKIRVWAAIIIMAVAGIMLRNADSVEAAEQVSYDSNMKTNKYDVDIVIGEDGSYTVTEKIAVQFMNPRHGIYRYIPKKGKIVSIDKTGKNRVFYIMPISKLRKVILHVKNHQKMEM